jgi:hypothetical protein
VIAAEGRTIIGTRGLRTERARVVAWWTPRLRATIICNVQFVGAKKYIDVDDMCRDYGIPIAFDLSWKPDYGTADTNWWTV